MLMNSDLNSDSEQCTESKRGRVHSAHTLCSHYAQAACTSPIGSCVVARTGAISWPSPAVSLLCCDPPPVMIQKLYRDLTPAARTARRVARALGHIVGRVAALYRSLTASYCNTNGRPQCNTPKYTLVVFDMFRVFFKCKLNVS